MNILRTSTTLALPTAMSWEEFPGHERVQVAALMEAQRRLKSKRPAVIPDKTEAADSAAAEDTAEVEVFDIQLEDIVTPPSR